MAFKNNYDTVTVARGDNLCKIVKYKYGLKNNTDVMNVVNLIKKENNLKNVNVLSVGQEIKLPTQLRLNSIYLINPEDNSVEKMASSQKNFYRANDIFGDIATKKSEYPDQEFRESEINNRTKVTEYIEDVIANIRAFFTSDTARDKKAADIFAKQIGTWMADGKQASGGMALEKTDAYKFALEVNNDDFVMRETEWRGTKEEHAYFNNTTSDNKIHLFSLEEVNGKEYFTMRDKSGKVHYFDKSDNLKEVTME